MRATRLGVLCAAIALGLLVTAGGLDEGKGWGDATQALANLSWIGVLVAAAAAVSLFGKATVDHHHGGHARPHG